MDSRKLALLCREVAENKKAEDLVILDVRKLTSVADYFLVATGTSTPHLRAIVDEIDDRLRADYDVRPQARDGVVGSSWVVLDYGSVLVHVMRLEDRKRYDLEGLWSDAPRPKTRKRTSRKAKA